MKKLEKYHLRIDVAILLAIKFAFKCTENFTKYSDLEDQFKYAWSESQVRDFPLVISAMGEISELSGSF